MKTIIKFTITITVMILLFIKNYVPLMYEKEQNNVNKSQDASLGNAGLLQSNYPDFIEMPYRSKDTSMHIKIKRTEESKQIKTQSITLNNKERSK